MPTSVTATYTTPYDWASADTISEARLDAINSNIMFLKTPTQNRLANQATTNTTSATFVDITGATLTLSTNAYAATIVFVGSILLSTASVCTVTLLIDGTNQGDATAGIYQFSAGVSLYNGVTLPYHTAALTAASHTFKLQWKTSAGTITLQNGWHMYAIER